MAMSQSNISFETYTLILKGNECWKKRGGEQAPIYLTFQKNGLNKHDSGGPVKLGPSKPAVPIFFFMVKTMEKNKMKSQGQWRVSMQTTTYMPSVGNSSEPVYTLRIWCSFFFFLVSSLIPDSELRGCIQSDSSCVKIKL